MKCTVGFLNVFIIIVLSSCYVSKKLSRDVKVFLQEDNGLKIQFPNDSSLINAYTKEEYNTFFMEGLRKEFELNHIVEATKGFEFSVEIQTFVVKESVKIEIVSDLESPDNGKEYELTSVEMNLKGIIKDSTDKQIASWWAEKEKSERITSNRSVIDYALGANKKANVYREKELSSYELKDLAYHCGRRSAVRIIKAISKNVK